jgi:hypothetical protein
MLITKNRTLRNISAEMFRSFFIFGENEKAEFNLFFREKTN